MDAIATINVRMPESLKGHGTQVLERSGISPSELVRSTYRFLEKEQRIPECLDIASAQEDPFTYRRKLLRTIRKNTKAPLETSVSELQAERIEQKYGDLL